MRRSRGNTDAAIFDQSNDESVPGAIHHRNLKPRAAKAHVRAARKLAALKQCGPYALPRAKRP
jgi:hypothetical protein